MFAGDQANNFNMQSSGTLSETIRLPDDMVGLIIGRGGENIMKMQRETGCRIQITQSIPGTKERPCTLSGTQEQIEVCKNMLDEIVARSKASGMTNGSIQPGFNGMGGMGDGQQPSGPSGQGEETVEMSIPAERCGLVIGKGGETIKMLQTSLQVKMLLIQDSVECHGMPKPLRISGEKQKVQNAVNAITQMLQQRDAQVQGQTGRNNMGGGFGEQVTKIQVPKNAVGVVIGKGGEMINQIQGQTMTRVQFKPEDQHAMERECTISGNKDGVDQAVRRIQDLINQVQERDGNSGGNYGGNFGHWEAPNMQGGMGNQITEEHLVPANRTGLVIGKGGETIKQINAQSGARAQIVKDPPPSSDPNYKIFNIKGTPEQIKMCRQLIQEKVDGNMGGGNHGNGNNSFSNQQFGGQFQQPQPAVAMSTGQFGQFNGGFQQQQQQQTPQWAPTAQPNPAAAPQVDYSKQWAEYFKSTGQVQEAARMMAGGDNRAPQQPGAAQPGQPGGQQTDYTAQWQEYYRQLALQQQQFGVQQPPQQ